MNQENRLKELALLFLKLGIIGFGGPAVHIAMMEEEVVRKRKWMDHRHFLDLVGATNLIPGPNSTEMTMHIGRERAGWKGLIVAGCCFIFPAVIITAVFAWLYVAYGTLPGAERFIYGIKPAILSVLAVTMFNLSKKAFLNWYLGLAALAAMVLAFAGINEIMLLFGFGCAALLIRWWRTRNLVGGIFPFFLLQAPAFLQAGNAKIFFSFLKIGSILYGSGYVLFSFLDAELVAKGLLTRLQLTDAIAVGQFTPGPVFSAATFIGYLLNGWPGAIAATLGIFLPSFLFVALLNPLIPFLRRSTIMAAFLDMVNAVAIALILVLVIRMGAASFENWKTVVIAVAGIIATILFPRINTALVVAGGALLGYLLYPL